MIVNCVFLHVQCSFNKLFTIFFCNPNRKDGVNRLIRILFRDGYYGFADPLEFRSVVQLVEHYRHHSLQPYSPKLDITLQEPVSKFKMYDVESEGPQGKSEEVSYMYIVG